MESGKFKQVQHRKLLHPLVLNFVLLLQMNRHETDVFMQKKVNFENKELSTNLDFFQESPAVTMDGRPEIGMIWEYPAACQP